MLFKNALIREAGSQFVEVIRTGENMKKGQIYEGVIESVDFPNKAFIVTKEIDAEGEVKDRKSVV